MVSYFEIIPNEMKLTIFNYVHKNMKLPFFDREKMVCNA